MGHPNPLCPVHDTDETLIGCPCNDVAIDGEGIVIFTDEAMLRMPKLYSQASINKLVAENERLRDLLHTVAATIHEEWSMSYARQLRTDIERAEHEPRRGE